jgi:hypothetical protein
MSVDFDMNEHIQYTDRTSYDMLNMMGDVGGVLEILLVMGRLLSTSFASYKIKAILTNRLFHLSYENRKSFFGQVHFTDE